jgi:hypothetical protein
MLAVCLEQIFLLLSPSFRYYLPELKTALKTDIEIFGFNRHNQMSNDVRPWAK